MTKSPQKIIEFIHKAGELKTATRFKDSKNMVGDSAAEHSWRTALMTFILLDELKIKVNVTKALEIALVHDVVESVVGNVDYTSILSGKISEKQKKALEEKAISQLTKLLPQASGSKISALWHEYEKGITKEAKFVKAMNRLETMMYLLEVGHKGYDKPESIPNYADKVVIDFPVLHQLLKEIKGELKEEFKKGGLVWKKEFD
jgi:putative hydrolases of HD superfamily